MFHKQSILRSSFYSIFILLVASALLLASCGGKPAVVAATPTKSAATPTPLAGAAATPVTSLPSPMPVVPTGTPIVPTVTPVLALDTPTAVIVNNPVPLNQSEVATVAAPSTSSAPTATVQILPAVVSSVPPRWGPSP